jgi:hypothetical protein
MSPIPNARTLFESSSRGRVTRRERVIIKAVPHKSARSPALKTIRLMRTY